MSTLEVIGIVASCIRAFHNGAEVITRLQARDGLSGVAQSPLSPRAIVLQEMLQESMIEGQIGISSHFKAEQERLGTHGYLLRKGDDIAKQELLFVAFTLQDEIFNKLGHDLELNRLRAEDNLKSLHETAIEKRQAAIRSISELRHRLQDDLPVPSSSRQTLDCRNDASSKAAASFVPDAVAFSRTTSQHAHDRPNSLSTIRQSTHLIPEIRADDIDALTIQESMLDDDRYTIAPEAPFQAVVSDIPPSSRHAPTPRHAPPRMHDGRTNFTSAASMRAAAAPESSQSPAPTMTPWETVGPYFPPGSLAAGVDNCVPTLPKRRDRPSVPESQAPRSDSMPWATRIFSKTSLPSPSSSPRISEPDSAISFKVHNTKPYCSGAIAAQENFIDGFRHDSLPVLPGSDKRELCWKCQECDFNASDGEGQLLERVEFKLGTRFRFKLLARSHVPYSHPRNALKPRYNYGCLFCTAEGKQSATHTSIDTLMSHIREKHHTILTPEVKKKTNCVTGRLAERHEDWDCNFPDVSKKKGAFGKALLHAVTSLPT